jgi:hypothetical protein
MPAMVDERAGLLVTVSACIKVHLCVKSDNLRDLKIQIRIQFVFENAVSDLYFIDGYGSAATCKSAVALVSILSE